MLEGIFGIILGAILDFLLTAAGELSIELLFRTIRAPFDDREDRNPVFAGMGYALFGLVVGGVSLLIFPNSFARSKSLPGISLLVTPVLCGLLMAGVGWWREQHGQKRIRLDSFLYGYIFALSMAVVRFLYTS